MAGNGSGAILQGTSRRRLATRRSRAPVQPGPQEVPTPRRWGFVAVGALLVLGCGLVSLALYRSAGNRVPVVVVARDIDQWETIERGDLDTALVAAESGVDTIPESELDDLVGRVAVTRLPSGALPSPEQVSDDDQVAAANEALVGARLGPGAAPTADLPAGTRILVVIRPGTSTTDAPVRQVPGRLAELGDRDPNSGAREASLVVPQADAADVAAAAAEERIAVVGLGA